MSQREPPNVVDLQSRQESLEHIQPRFQQLIQACRKITMNSTSGLLSEVFENIDDSLFKAAEKAENNELQNTYFDSMREIRMHRHQAERVFHQEISQLFTDFINLKPQLSEFSNNSELAADQMSLIKDEVYEESLVVTNMATKVNGRCTEALYALNQRFSIIINGIKVTDESNPVGAKKIAICFCRALTTLEVDKRIQAILFHLFEGYVMSNMDKIYDDLNKRLIQADVLPNLKFSASQYAESRGIKKRPQTPPAARQRSSQDNPANEPQRTTSSQAQPRQQSKEQSTQESSASAPTQNNHFEQYDENLPNDPAMEGSEYTPTAINNEIFSEINDILSHRRAHKMPMEIPEANFRSVHAFSPPSEGLLPYTTEDLLKTLTELQREKISSDSSPFTTPQSVNEFKDELVNRLNSHSETNQNITPEDADIIDLVGMLFDFILDDENLPEICKTALSHLHTPYLKIALTDKEMFVRHQHPARRLLNNMAQAAILWAPDEKNDRGVLAKIQFIVRRIIQGYEGNNELFDDLIADFNNFINLLKRQSEIIERRAVEATKGRDRLLSARTKAKEAIEPRIKSQQPPKAATHFLSSSWSDVLVFIFLRHGENSEIWQRAINITDDIFWSVEAKYSKEEKNLLKEKQPHLITSIKQFLINLGGHPEEEIKGLVKPLVQCQRAALRAVKGEPLKTPAVPTLEEPIHEATTPELGSLTQDAELESTPATEEQDVDVDPELINRLKVLEFGTWFDFTLPDQTIRRLKLSWFSPITLNYMFVDGSGNKAVIKPIYALATEMTIGRTRFAMIDKTPLMDRAMEKIHDILKLFMK